MSVVDTPQSPGRAIVVRGNRLRGAVCWVRGHRWADGGRERELLAVMCLRCKELILTRHHDPDEPGSVFGFATVARAAVEMLSSAVLDQPERWQRARWLLIENPPAAVDALGRLTRMFASAPRCANAAEVEEWLQWAASQASLEMLGREMDADG